MSESEWEWVSEVWGEWGGGSDLITRTPIDRCGELKLCWDFTQKSRRRLFPHENHYFDNILTYPASFWWHLDVSDIFMTILWPIPHIFWYMLMYLTLFWWHIDPNFLTSIDPIGSLSGPGGGREAIWIYSHYLAHLSSWYVYEEVDSKDELGIFGLL